ncbi:TetR/AcrR family transcriptional regulator [Nocardia sp. NEAU-G5]|uniref:TetR/AcrR family transcriptional regulator n=1 Tax=Nocardia albiluteola TaxID=2842303 RepID=A0ABS6B035_9NOCA|nr:TetR/AcrR family transcriptional regulator [Nocardia albiluteola]MBU3063667.1 TetR/AcrR family transcriptional regulator [Nocardia albiluteola]
MVEAVGTATNAVPGSARPRRRDARDNREKVIAAARARFTAEGLDASLNAIARDAGVSIGTLYNHFPTRDALIGEAMLERVERSARSAEAALAAPDPWTGLVDHLTALAQWQAVDRGFTDLCVRSLPPESPLEITKMRGHRLFREVIARAQASGALRDDVDVTDIGLLLWSVVRATDGARERAPEAWRRHMGVLLDGLRSGAAHPLSGPAIDDETLGAAMRSGH